MPSEDAKLGMHSVDELRAMEGLPPETPKERAERRGRRAEADRLRREAGDRAAREYLRRQEEAEIRLEPFRRAFADLRAARTLVGFVDALTALRPYVDRMDTPQLSVIETALAKWEPLLRNAALEPDSREALGLMRAAVKDMQDLRTRMLSSKDMAELRNGDSNG